MNDFQKRIALKVQYYLDIAHDRLGFFAPDFDYDFNLIGKSGGIFVCMVNSSSVHYRQVLRFNLSMMKQDPEKFLKEVVGHEVAHMVAENMYGMYKKPANHGVYWKHVMRVFGLEPKRTHDFDISPESGVILRQTKRFEVKCSCTTYLITSHHRTKMMNGSRYDCLKCKTPVRLVA